MSATHHQNLSVPLLFLCLLGASLCVPQHSHASDWNFFGWGKKVTGSGVHQTENRAVSGYRSVKLAGSFDVNIVQDGNEGITIHAEDNVLPLIATDVERGDLIIKWRERNLSVSHKKVTITVHAKDIEAVSVAGSGSIQADAIKSPRLKTSIAGSGDIRINNLSAGALKVSISGSGDFTAAGTADEFEASIAGSGAFKTERLKTKRRQRSNLANIRRIDKEFHDA